MNTPLYWRMYYKTQEALSHHCMASFSSSEQFGVHKGSSLPPKLNALAHKITQTEIRMKLFRVNLYYEEVGYCVIEAESAEEAEKAVNAKMANNGLDDLVIKLTDLVYNTTGTQEITR